MLEPYLKSTSSLEKTYWTIDLKKKILSLPGNSVHRHFGQACSNLITTTTRGVQVELQSWHVIVAHFAVLSDICGISWKYLLINSWTSYWTWQFISTWLNFFESFHIFHVGWKNRNPISINHFTFKGLGICELWLSIVAIWIIFSFRL